MGDVAEFFGVMMAVSVPIIVIVFIAKYFKYKTTMAKQLGEIKSQMQNNSTDDLEKEVAALKERIVVLESIVTGRSYNLERKISSL